MRRKRESGVPPRDPDTVSRYFPAIEQHLQLQLPDVLRLLVDGYLFVDRRPLLRELDSLALGFVPGSNPIVRSWVTGIADETSFSIPSLLLAIINLGGIHARTGRDTTISVFKAHEEFYEDFELRCTARVDRIAGRKVHLRCAASVKFIFDDVSNGTGIVAFDFNAANGAVTRHHQDGTPAVGFVVTRPESESDPVSDSDWLIRVDADCKSVIVHGPTAAGPVRTLIK